VSGCSSELEMDFGCGLFLGMIHAGLWYVMRCVCLLSMLQLYLLFLSFCVDPGFSNWRDLVGEVVDYFLQWLLA